MSYTFSQNADGNAQLNQGLHLLPATASDMAVQQTQASMLPFRNVLVNPRMEVAQIATSGTLTAGAALNYIIDQWYAYCTGANVAWAQVAGTNQTHYRMQFTGAASVSAIGYAQRVEAKRSYYLNGTPTVVGVDMSNSLLTTVTWTAYYANTADTFGTLASPTRTQISTGTITVSSSLTRYYIPIPVPSAAVTGIEIVFSVGAQTSGTWVIGDAQWEQVASGVTVGTSIETKPYDQVLRECQRYLPYLASTGTSSIICSAYAGAATGAEGVVSLPVQTRVPITGLAGASYTTPTQLAFGNSVSFTASAVALAANPTVNQFAIILTISGATSNQGGIFYFNNANGNIYGIGAQI